MIGKAIMAIDPAGRAKNGPAGAQSLSLSERKSFAFLFVFALPVLCFVIDFKLQGLVSTTYPILAWTAAALGMAAYAASLWTWSGFALGFVTSFVAGGGAFAGLAFVLLLPFSVIFLTAVIGILGFIPLGTAIVFGRRAADMLERRPTSSLSWKLGLASGAILYALIPWSAQSAHDRNMRDLTADLRLTDDAQRRTAFEAIARTPFCDQSCKMAVCLRYTPKERDLVEKIIGGDPAFRCDIILD